MFNKHHTKETKKKMRKAIESWSEEKKEQKKQNTRKIHSGKVTSKNTKDKMRKAAYKRLELENYRVIKSAKDLSKKIILVERVNKENKVKINKIKGRTSRNTFTYYYLSNEEIYTLAELKKEFYLEVK
jgi:hypothetical protein